MVQPKLEDIQDGHCGPSTLCIAGYRLRDIRCTRAEKVSKCERCRKQLDCKRRHGDCEITRTHEHKLRGLTSRYNILIVTTLISRNGQTDVTGFANVRPVACGMRWLATNVPIDQSFFVAWMCYAGLERFMRVPTMYYHGCCLAGDHRSCISRSWANQLCQKV